MGVKFRNFFATGGDTIATSFSDTFLRAGGDLGPNWLQFSCPYTPIATPPNFFQIIVSGTADSVSMQPGGGVNNAAWAPPVFAIPRAVIQSLYGKTQFAQMTFLSQTNTARGGPGVMMDGNGEPQFTCYQIGLSAASHLQLFRNNGATSTTTLQADLGLVVANDIVRLSADLSVAGQVTLRTSKNGVVIDTTVDNAAGRLTTGCPGMQLATASTNPTGIAKWTTFSCGLGL